MNDERQKMIKELQDNAERVLALKQEHRQKRPIVIEFSGSPKAGKTSCINSLELFLKRNGFTVKIVQERASVCPVSDKQSPMFNIWTACTSLSAMIETLEKNDIDVLILDRGIFDALCWFEWLSKNQKMEYSQKKYVENFLLIDDFVKSIDIVFSFKTSPEKSIEREYATLLTNKLGSIMNKKVLDEYLSAIDRTIESKRQFFHKIKVVETSDKNQNQVSMEVTTKTLETLKDLLMEKIGFFEISPNLQCKLKTKKVFICDELQGLLPMINYDLRDIVEENDKYIQPIPVAVITNKERNKILVIKKNKKATSHESPEMDKILLYIGGHSRFEDKTEAMGNDFISLCKSTLKRELKEEIGISIALNDSKPICIYTPSNNISRKHLAVCFLIVLEENSIKIRLDSQELISNKGKSKSGRFLTIEEICNEVSLEEWCLEILKYFFNVNFNDYEQLSFGDV